MPQVQNVLLSNTLSLLQMAREAARAKGYHNQLEKFEPVVDHLTNLVASVKPEVPSAPSEIFTQNDFSSLLNVVRSEKKSEDQNSRLQQRNNMIYAMSAGGMNDLEIARYLGITRDEVRIVLNLAKVDVKRGVQ